MPSPEAPPRPSIFLSYPSEDRAAARALRDALAQGGLEVWYDEEELTGGDSWDQKIRRQIRECDYFMPVISAQSESRREGYFRREWRLAVERTLDMADDHLFLLPIVIDATEQAGARVPEKFFTVQWLRVPGGQSTPALQALCRRLLSGEADAAAIPARRVPPPLKASVATPAAPEAKASPAIPPFPNQEPGQPVKFWAHVAMWLGKAAWIQFGRLPRIIRILILLYLAYLVLSDGSHKAKLHIAAPVVPHPTNSELETKLNSIAARYENGDTKGDAVRLGTDIAKEFAAELGDRGSTHAPFLAIPFSAGGANPEEEKVANATFVMLYGRLSISHPNKVALDPEHLSPDATVSAATKAKQVHAQVAILGGIETLEGKRVLTVSILRVKTSTLVWTQHYSLTDADAEKIAAEIEKNLPDLDDDEDN